MSHCFGAEKDDVILLLDFGYSADEVADLLMDNGMFQEAVREVKLMSGEYIYDNYCYGSVF